MGGIKHLVSMLAIVLTGVACLPAGALAAFGLNNFDVTFTNADGSPAAQAGSHPFAFITSLGVNLSGEEPDGRLRELFLDLPPGLVGDATYPGCTDAQFNTLDEGVSGCPLETAVGISASSFGESGNWISAPVFNLVAPPGVLVRLGFRVADAENVVVDVELSPEPPYRAVVTMADIPETIELFGLKVQLWGNPSDLAHDTLRGGSVEPRRPFLTLPTSCDGPLASFYEALSWEGDEDWGSALTHDGAGNPLGFVGCRLLGFDPFLSAQPTTEAAQSPTGLDVSLDVLDEGLSNPEGLAQSHVRDLALALPGGMSASASLASTSGSCSEADIEAETPEAAPEEGCPESSGIGTAEVESPLAGGPMVGAIYRAAPHKNFAGDAAIALYIVLKNPDLGIVVTQPVGLEEDPETGELVAIAEEMPQLPFSHLRLHVDDGALVSPTFCNNYTAEANFATWSGEGPFRITSSFPIVSGPNGGPCPTDDRETQPEETAGSSSVAGAAPASTGSGNPHWRASTKRRCRKGKHRVRRHGRTRCVKKGHR